MSFPPRHLAIFAPVTAALSLAGCSRPAVSDPGADKAAKVIPVAAASPGGKLHRVTLSADAVTRLDIQTAPVRMSEVKRIPFAAVIYDAQGQSWTYVVVAERTYQRAPITIARIDGDLAVLDAGPDPGMPVVTAGAPELLGVEYGVGEE